MCVCTQGCGHTVQSRLWSQIVRANESKVGPGWQGLMIAHFVPCQYAFMLAVACVFTSVLAWLGVFECCYADWGLETMQGHPGRAGEERKWGKEKRSWQVNVKQTVNLWPLVTGVLSLSLSQRAHALNTQHNNTLGVKDERALEGTWHVAWYSSHNFTHKHTHSWGPLCSLCSLMEGAVRGEGWGHVRELEPGATASLMLTRLSVFLMGYSNGVSTGHFTNWLRQYHKEINVCVWDK